MNRNKKTYEQILDRLRLKKSIALNVISTENLKTLKCNIFLIKHQFFLLFVVIVAVNIKNIKKQRICSDIKIFRYSDINNMDKFLGSI